MKREMVLKTAQGLIALVLLLSATYPTILAQKEPPGTLDPPIYAVQTDVLEDGMGIDKILINGPPDPLSGHGLTRVASLETVPEAVVILDQVPAYNWSFGCSATAAAMIAAYYDRTDYPDMYTGPTNGGVMPMDNSVWPDWVDSNGNTRHQCPLSATHNGLDGRTTFGHVDDYWIYYGQPGPDPWDGNWPEHAHGDCTADFMKTNQWVNPASGSNIDGGTTFYNYTSGAPLYDFQIESYGLDVYDGGYGLKLFYESKGYAVDTMFNQYIHPNYSIGFTYDQYRAEIDAGRPVMLHLEGHTVVGVGYDESSDMIYVHDTWDYSTHTMTWGGRYPDPDTGLLHYGVTIIELAEGGLVSSAATGNWYSGSTWDSGSVPGANGAVTIEADHTVTVDGDVQCHDFAAQSDGGLVVPIGVAFNVADDLSSYGKLQGTRDVSGSSDVGFFDTGGYGGVILSAEGNADLGSTTVIIRGNQDCTGGSAGSSIRRCLSIAPTEIGPFSARVRFYFSASELGAIPCDDVTLWHWQDLGWVPAGTIDPATGRQCEAEPYYVEATGITGFSPFVGDNDQPLGNPTTVRLARFEAWPAADGLGIEIEWETTSEIDTLGYDISRSTEPASEGTYVRLNADLIPSSIPPGSPLGATYTWLDENTSPGTIYYYVLGDVDVYGTETLHGPVSALLAQPEMTHAYLPLVLSESP